MTNHSKKDKSITEPAQAGGVAMSPTPLSRLPKSVLFRSFFVAAVSSNSFLLSPALKLLMYFSQPTNNWFFDVNRNPILHAILRKTLYNQFCAGESKDEVKACVKQLKHCGFRGVILTYAKEVVFDERTESAIRHPVCTEKATKGAKAQRDADTAIESWLQGTLATVDLCAEGDVLAIKLSGGGPSVARSFVEQETVPEQFRIAIDEVAVKCKERGIHIIIDAESQRFQKSIDKLGLDLMRRYNCRGEAVVYNTYQAYLKSTPETLSQHLEAAAKYGFTLGLKIVRGAYMHSENRSLIHDTKQDTDDAYDSIAQGALRREYREFGLSKPFPSVNLLLASHNKASVLAAHALHQQRVDRGLPTVPVIFAQLHGMSDGVSFSLLQTKGRDGSVPDVYKCTTWGSMAECLGYLLRRAMENRDAVTRTHDEVSTIRHEISRRFRLIFRQ